MAYGTQPRALYLYLPRARELRWPAQWRHRRQGGRRISRLDARRLARLWPGIVRGSIVDDAVGGASQCDARRRRIHALQRDQCWRARLFAQSGDRAPADDGTAIATESRALV